ncbi:FAD-dependent monooxygenase [Streptomyces sp. NPDC059650]|uniref:FAD-dependent monooxygenase n=1 Tax=Streptomyces sp. NPDC059650 TaxID=3346896 RepID=UPI0036A70EA1
MRPLGTVAWIGTVGVETGVHGETGGAGRFFGMTPVLVGDAAHAMTPNPGQGARTALLDAGALTRAVAARGRAGLPAAPRAYGAERRRPAARPGLPGAARGQVRGRAVGPAIGPLGPAAGARRWRTCGT